MEIVQAKLKAKEILINANYNNCNRIIEQLMFFVLKGKETKELTSEEYNEFISCVKRKVNGEPLERIIGVTEFYDCIFEYSDNVLTPRQETEILVDMIAKENFNRLKLLDMCSGSGCIGISLAKAKNFDVTLCDISDFAIENSTKNAKLNKVDVKIVKSNLFENIDATFDIIVSNPPYIKSEVIKNLEKEVLNYDPILALDGGADGMLFYREIIKSSPKYLKPNGKIYLEIDNGLEKEIENLLKENFKNIKIKKDYSNNFRFAIAEKKEEIC